MIPTPVLYNDNADYTIVIMMIACCLIVLATIMIPKAIRHRKRIKECEKPVQNEEQEVEMIVVEVSKKDDSKKILNYKETFIRRNEIKTRVCVYISHSMHDKIVKLTRALEDTNVTIGGYIDTVLSEHLERHKDEINEIYRKSRENLL